MRRHLFNQLVLDLDRGGRAIPSAPAPDGLLQALGDLLLEALGNQNKAIPMRREACDAFENHA
jgi:hypothetical protein